MALINNSTQHKDTQHDNIQHNNIQHNDSLQNNGRESAINKALDGSTYPG
jgi:hypothetical protein